MSEKELNKAIADKVARWLDVNRKMDIGVQGRVLDLLGDGQGYSSNEIIALTKAHRTAVNSALRTLEKQKVVKGYRVVNSKINYWVLKN